MTYTLAPLFCRPWTLNGISPRLIESHYENNYGAAVMRLNAVTQELESVEAASPPDAQILRLKRDQASALNSTLLHELYFSSLGGDGRTLPDIMTDGVTRELTASIAQARTAGIAHDAIVIDPGFGFAKTPSQNFRLLSELDALVALGWPVLVGPSRKRFLGEATGRPIDDRDRATAAVCALAHDRGARLFRLHDPAAARDALAIAAALHPGEP